MVAEQRALSNREGHDRRSVRRASGARGRTDFFTGRSTVESNSRKRSRVQNAARAKVLRSHPLVRTFHRCEAGGRQAVIIAARSGRQGVPAAPWPDGTDRVRARSARGQSSSRARPSCWVHSQRPNAHHRNRIFDNAWPKKAAARKTGSMTTPPRGSPRGLLITAAPSPRHAVRPTQRVSAPWEPRRTEHITE